MSFGDFFEKGTGFGPYPYQCRLATRTEDGQTTEGVECESRLIHVPTGAGKTEAVVMAWLWNRVHLKRPDWPRRLVYCLPMRVLVEQTRDRTVLILHRLGLLGGKVEIEGERGKEKVRSYEPGPDDERPVEGWAKEIGYSGKRIAVHIIMGGEADKDWDRYPERNAILIGTQDMLLSRALNRGYALSRSRWPVDFAWVNNDTLWVLDEVQLMGSGLSSSTQLQAWRETNLVGGEKGQEPVFGSTHAWWMSATLQPDWLKSVDFEKRVERLLRKKVELSFHEKKSGGVAERYKAKKRISQAKRESSGRTKKTSDLKAGEEGYEESVAEFVVKKHNNQRQFTLVILNKVERAVKVFEAIRKATKTNDKIKVELLHSRFRLHERRAWTSFLSPEAYKKDQLPDHGRIVVSTQVVEAGVDMSAKVLVTELAPWPSLIQRLGRANRYGEYNKEDGAEIYWLDITDKDLKPYGEKELPIKEVRSELAKVTEASPEAIDRHLHGLSTEKRKELFHFEPQHVPREKDLYELFDTTPDLTGADIDISRFIRDDRDIDVHLFWRDVGGPNTQVEESRDELCPVPFYEFQRVLKDLRSKGRIWRWDYIEGEWVEIGVGDMERVYPGQVFLLQKGCGGYSEEVGWTGKPGNRPSWIGTNPPGKKEAREGEHMDPSSKASWRTIVEHGEDVRKEVDRLLSTLPDLRGHAAILRLAACLHDWGKAAKPFQSRIEKARYGKDDFLLAKAPDEAWLSPSKWTRPGFRHELASALAVFETVYRARPNHTALAMPYEDMLRVAGTETVLPGDQDRLPEDGLARELSELDEGNLNLLTYLICAHHGKVRLTLRASPRDLEDETAPADGRQARGVRDGEAMPRCELAGPSGGQIQAPRLELHLDLMEAGLSPRYGPSWQERALALRDAIGPFRLAYLEALLRIADWRVSR